MLNNESWFFEQFELKEGRSIGIEIKELLESKQSEFQKIEVYDTVSFGRMLVLDGAVQLTEFDNFAYHEMISHVPMIAHPNPEKILIAGGGDGGVLTELLKHSSVKEVVLCDIDSEVIETSRKYFPEFSKSFDDARVEVVTRDVNLYLEDMIEQFDVICVDSTDPIGPARVLFEEDFYRKIYNSLKADGIAVSQSESMYYHSEFIRKLYLGNSKFFDFTAYYYTIVPSYPSGTIGFLFYSKRFDYYENIDYKRIESLSGLKYYNERIHKAAFSLPNFAKNIFRVE